MTEEPMNQLSQASEAGSLARRMAANYLQMVEFYQERMLPPPDEAHGEVRDLVGYDTEHILDAPPDQVGWFALQRVLEHDPERGYSAWERIKAEAREELASGHRAAAALEWSGSPWGRAQFLAIRDAFRTEWHPRGGIEDALIDTLAQAHASYLYWVEQLHILATTEGQLHDHKLKKRATGNHHACKSMSGSNKPQP